MNLDEVSVWRDFLEEIGNPTIVRGELPIPALPAGGLNPLEYCDLLARCEMPSDNETVYTTPIGERLNLFANGINRRAGPRLGMLNFEATLSASGAFGTIQFDTL